MSEKEQNEQPELDENRPNITIGYKKGSEDGIVAQSNTGSAMDEIEVLILLLQAAFQQNMGYLNKLLYLEQEARKQREKQQGENKGIETNEGSRYRDTRGKSE